MERLSYLSVLKNSLFKFTEPSVPEPVNNDKMDDNNINNKDLREEWIYVHDDNNSQMDELLDLNDSSEYSIPSVCDAHGMTNKKMSNLSTFEKEQQEKKAKEIIKNRNAWLEKRKKEKLNSQNIIINNKNIRSKVNKRRRNTNSTSSNDNSSFKKDVNSSSNINISNLFDENSNFVKNSMKYTTESVVNTSDIVNNHQNKDSSSPYNLRSKSNKKPKLQNLSRCKPNHKFTTLNQPMAKGMC
jgi:hypothetical protein